MNSKSTSLKGKSQKTKTACLYVGGQAVIEGVMMRSPHSLAVAVRKSNGNLVIKEEEWRSVADRWRLFKLPFFRGPVVLYETLLNGIQALNFSAAAALDEGEKPMSNWSVVITLSMAIFLALAFFVVLPHFLSALFGRIGPIRYQISSGLFHVIDGILKIFFFFLYLIIISLFKDIKRVFQYHGAEHKSIYTYESGEELKVENARKHSTLHPRCGTAFLLIVLVLSIFVFSLYFVMIPEISFGSAVVKNIYYILAKILLLFPLAGISYEIIRVSGKYSHHPFLKLILLPGLWMQKLTTREPMDDQIEVALKALEAALVIEKNWNQENITQA